ncbi:hypothetical protein [Piscirickettsia litoralis]|uniref:hypothetical protein n=1 Tax=Piscirickettsia litoralis TaxID=1891921 RepID=UPI001F217311|nr:hypothetical protein [Piscirickettsia litoralis]
MSLPTIGLSATTAVPQFKSQAEETAYIQKLLEKNKAQEQKIQAQSQQIQALNQKNKPSCRATNQPKLALNNRYH